MRKIPRKPKGIKEPPFVQCCCTFLVFYILIVICYLKEIFGYKSKLRKEIDREGYSPLYSPADRLFSTHIYPRVWHCFNNVSSSLASDRVVVKQRMKDEKGHVRFTGKTFDYINYSSFNYLGLSRNTGESVDAVETSIKNVGIVASSSYRELGNTLLHKQIEQLTMEFLGAEAVISFGMGFATNTMNLPSIITKECLVLSDQKNHASMILGLKLCGVTVRVFKHNDMENLEEMLIDGIYQGQPNGTPWKKIFIVTEGIFSMEGTVVNLPEIVALKKKYKAYLYIDEAHSIGVLGDEGKGVTQHFGVDPREIDIWMGTYSKGFASFGGFIAGSRKLINFLRKNSQGSFYSAPLPMAVIPKLINSLEMCLGKHDNKVEIHNRINQLRRNTHYFRERLLQMGIVVCGDADSPIVPIISYFASKMIETSRILAQEYKIAVAAVGYPAVDVFGSRLRICLSADHTKDQLDYTLDAISEINDRLGLDYDHSTKNDKVIEY